MFFKILFFSSSSFSSAFRWEKLKDKNINEGLKEEQIYEFLREKYGDWIIYDPQLNKNTYILWLLPLLLFLVGGAIIQKKITKKNGK